MKVDDMLRLLEAEIQRIKTRFCEYCQEWDCDMCPYEMEVQDGANRGF